MSENESRRKDFIKEMYHVYWANMDRSMEGVWKILAPITVSGTIIAGVHTDYLPASLGITLAIVIILWALNVTIDLNAWHRRNLFFLAKAEKEFLSPEDYGRLLPARYKQPPKKWITFYKINAYVFVVFLMLTLLYGAFWELRADYSSWLLPGIFLIVGVVLTILNACAQEKSAKKHFKELF